MRFRTFPNTDVTVSEIGFGVWTLITGWWGEKTDDQAVDLLRQAVDLGVTFFDTGDTYGNGRGESILAKAFPTDRDKVVIGTKFGYDIYSPIERPRGQRELPHDWRPEFVRYACEQSLKRLGTDYIDLYQLHNPRMDAILNDDLFAELDKLRDEGKIRAYGAALGPAIGGTEHGDEALRARPMAALQIIYNLLEQDPGRRFFPIARETGTGILVRVPHSSGLLEGKYTEDTTFPPTDHRGHRPRSWLIDGLKKLAQLGFLTEGRDATIGQMALKFVLAEPAVMSALPNIYDADQLVEFAAASDLLDLTAEDLSRIEALYGADFGLVASRQ